MNKNKQTAVSLVGTDVPTMLSAIAQKIKNHNKVNDTVYKTTGQLEGFKDITVETSIAKLICAFSMVYNKEKAYDETAGILGLSTYPAFSISGGNTSAWEHDIKLRIAIISQSETLAKLKAAQDKLSKFLTEEDQKAAVMKELAGLFND